MHLIAHVFTRPADALAQEIINRQRQGEKNEIVVVDLTVPQPNYKQLLENIFAADSVQVW